MSNNINLIGSVCSILGAIFALYQARASKSAAEISESIKIQLIDHRKISDLAELQALLKSAQNAFNKYGTSNPSSLKGVDHNSDAEVVLEFINKLLVYREYFSDYLSNAADDTYNDIYSTLSKFKSTNSPNTVSKLGAEILNSVTGFSPNLQKELNSNKEKTG